MIITVLCQKNTDYCFDKNEFHHYFIKNTALTITLLEKKCKYYCLRK